MKILRLFFVHLLAIFAFSASAQAHQNVKEETVKVWGNCEMCKARIEKAARAAGAVTANWDIDSKILSISYPAATTSVAKIEKSVAGAGYDTNMETASQKSYKALPQCCQYERKDLAKSNKN